MVKGDNMPMAMGESTVGVAGKKVQGGDEDNIEVLIDAVVKADKKAAADAAAGAANPAGPAPTTRKIRLQKSPVKSTSEFRMRFEP